MNNGGFRNPQTMLYLRLLMGGYLVYLAWDLRSAVQESPVFLAAVIVFGLVGGALVFQCLKTLLRPAEPEDPASE